MAHEDYLDSLLHNLEGKSEENTLKPEKDNLEEKEASKVDEYEFLKSFDEELMNSMDDDFMKDFEEELNLELAKKNPGENKEIEEDELHHKELTNIPDDILREEEESEVKTDEYGEEDYSHHDDEILKQFLGSEEEKDIKEEKEEDSLDMGEQDIMDLINSLSDDEDIADIGELLRKDENHESVESDDDKRGLLEDIGESVLKKAGDNITDIPPNDEKVSNNKEEKKEEKKEKKKEKKQKKEGGFFGKLFSKKSDSPKENPSNKKPLSENEKILIEMEEEDKQEKKKEDELRRKNKKEKKPKKEKKVKIKLPPPVQVEEPYKKASTASIILIFLLAGSLLVLAVVSTSLFSYSHDVNSAKKYFNLQQYDKAYEQIAGLDIKDEDNEFYNQVKIIMQLERQYNSYVNYKNLNKEAEALDSLLKGVSKYDIYYNQAKELGVRIQFDSIKDKIETVLLENYELTIDQARDINSVGNPSDYSSRILSMTQEIDE